MKRSVIDIKTQKKKQVMDLTEEINVQLDNMGAGEGLVNIFITHTTAALTTADLDPGTDLDMLDAFEAMVPKLKYRHPHNPAHVGDHILSSIIGSSVTLPVESGQLKLGTWQRVVLVEMDGPRQRQVVVSLV